MADKVICVGCGYRVEPIFIFDRSPKTNKSYLITKCPRESCGFNLDIEDYTGKPRRRPDNNPSDNDTGRGSGWRFGL